MVKVICSFHTSEYLPFEKCSFSAGSVFEALSLLMHLSIEELQSIKKIVIQGE